MIAPRSASYIILLMIIVFAAPFVLSDIYEACKAIKNRTFVASNISCSHYIYCDGDNSYEGVCADNDYFNERYQTCDPKELVECKLDNSSSSPPFTTASTPPFTKETTSQTITTNNGIITAGAITPTTSSSAATSTTTSSGATSANTAAQPPIVTSPSSVTPTPITVTTNAVVTNPSKSPSPSPSTNTALIISVECPSTDNPQQMVFVPHPTTCSVYFICYHGVALQMHCSSMLHFNTNTGKCDYAENVRCQANYSKPKEQCQPHTVDLFPHQNNCNYFYYCRNGFLLLQQCPFRSGWDYEKRACIAMDQAKCFSKTNRE